jgi:hypothetical protein
LRTISDLVATATLRQRREHDCRRSRDTAGSRKRAVVISARMAAVLNSADTHMLGSSSTSLNAIGVASNTGWRVSVCRTIVKARPPGPVRRASRALRRRVKPEQVGPRTVHGRHEVLFMRFSQHCGRPATPMVCQSLPANSSLREVKPDRPLSLECCIAAKSACIGAVID